MKQQKPMSIHKFKKGDRITRIQPSKPVAKIQDEEIVNRDHIGTPFIFVGIANGCIYLKRFFDQHTAEIMTVMNLFNSVPSDHLLNIELDLFEDGWSYYIDPMTLGDEKEEKNIYSIEELESQKEIALEKEDYKEAERIQKQIKKDAKKRTINR